MEYAKTIAMAESLLADGRAGDVVQMIDPLLDSVDAPAANTGQLLLRALRARVAVVHRDNPQGALDQLPSRSDVAELCTCVRADISLWRGWAHALRHRETGDAVHALRLLGEAQELQESIHNPPGRAWALLGRALAFYSIDEYGLLERALDNAEPLLDAIDDEEGRRWLHALRIPALRAAGHSDAAEPHVNAIRSLGTERQDQQLEGLASAYEACLRHDVHAPMTDIIDAAETAETLLRRGDRRSASALSKAYRVHVDALLQDKQVQSAQDVIVHAEENLPDRFADTEIIALRARAALQCNEAADAQSLLSPLLRASAPLPRGVSRARLFRLYGRTLQRREHEQEASAWLRRALRTARETRHRVEEDRVLRALRRSSDAEPHNGESDGAREPDAPEAPVPNRGLRNQTLVAQSEAMQRVLDQARETQPSRCPLLLTGEKGVGKRTLAQVVHESGVRSQGPLERVTAADMQHHPTENRLFGSVGESGELVPGAVHAADGGTLLIEDVEALSLSAQASLLRVLNTGTVAPEGGTEAQHVDVRLLATTTGDLDERIRNGHFRPALRDWLVVNAITIPPLRERRADIPLLVRHFLDALRPDGAAVVTVTQPAMEALLRYDWPGNVRQLQNEIERALVHVGSEPTPTIDTDVLLDTIVEQAQHNDPTPAADDPDAILHPNQKLDDVLSRTEKDIIERVLRACDGQVTASAEVLGLTRQGLYKKMKRLGIDASSFQPNADTPAAAA